MNREGELYKVLKVSDYAFEIRYGYYSEEDRFSKYSEVIPIFPDFITNPIYTTDGFPLVTKMQDKCSHFTHNKNLDSCYGCLHFEEGDDMIGICRCKHNKKT